MKRTEKGGFTRGQPRLEASRDGSLQGAVGSRPVLHLATPLVRRFLLAPCLLLGSDQCQKQRHLAHLLTHSALQELPTFIHRSKLLSEICLIAALALHVLTTDLQHRLVHEVRRQLLAVKVYLETLRERRETRTTGFHA